VVHTLTGSPGEVLRVNIEVVMLCDLVMHVVTSAYTLVSQLGHHFLFPEIRFSPRPSAWLDPSTNSVFWTLC